MHCATHASHTGGPVKQVQVRERIQAKSLGVHAVSINISCATSHTTPETPLLVCRASHASPQAWWCVWPTFAPPPPSRCKNSRPRIVDLHGKYLPTPRSVITCCWQMQRSCPAATPDTAPAAPAKTCAAGRRAPYPVADAPGAPRCPPRCCPRTHCGPPRAGWHRGGRFPGCSVHHRRLGHSCLHRHLHRHLRPHLQRVRTQTQASVLDVLICRGRNTVRTHSPPADRGNVRLSSCDSCHASIPNEVISTCTMTRCSPPPPPCPPPPKLSPP